MDFSYKNNTFDTGSNIEIRFHGETSITSFVEFVLQVAGKKGPIPATMGFVMQYFPFISNLSIIENIILPLEYHSNLNPAKAIDIVSHYINKLGLDSVTMKRKEDVSNSDLFKAMFIRAVAMEPEAVFFNDVEHFITLNEFDKMLVSFRQLISDRIKIWIGLSGGVQFIWDHDREVFLDS